MFKITLFIPMTVDGEGCGQFMRKTQIPFAPQNGMRISPVGTGGEEFTMRAVTWNEEAQNFEADLYWTVGDKSNSPDLLDYFKERLGEEMKKAGWEFHK